MSAYANAYLSGNGEAPACTAENYQVTVHVDRSALTNSDGHSGLPIETVKRLFCDGDAVVIVENEEGELSKVINYPSAEGLLSAAKTYSVAPPPS